jgi:tetratricopeptide (TPR) repeat protein
MNRTDQAAQEYMKVVTQAEARAPNYEKKPIGMFRYNVGKALMKMDRLELARRLFTAAIEDSTTAPRERALSYLYLAEVLDLTGNRPQAVANYQRVLNVANVEDSHTTAKAYLKTPYRRAK